MADQIKKLSAGHSIEVLDAIMTEVEEARGEYESLDARLDEISGEGYSKAEVDALLALKQNALTAAQLDAVNSGIDSIKVEQIETNKNNISLLTPTTYYHETTFAASNTWTDTTLTFTIPANTIYYFVASISWSSGQPAAICISTSSTASGVQSSNCIASSDVTGNIVTCFGQMTKTNNTDVTIYVYAKNASATGVSPVRLTAFWVS